MAAPAISPRHLVLKNLFKLNSRDADPTTDFPAREIIAPPNAGDMALYSFYAPSLIAGPTYTIQVSQDVQIPAAPDSADQGHHQVPMDDSGNSTLSQPFTVVAPQFKIDVKDIHSTYPPQGHADQPSVLPHIVFNDPHLPWERSPHLDDVDISDQGDQLPWLTVIPFDCTGPDGELQLSASQLNGANALYQRTDGSSLPLKQSATFSISMTLKDYLALDKNTSSVATKVFVPGPLDSIQDDLSTPVQVIFMSGKLFKQQFTSQSDPNVVDIDQYRYCAHVRNVNTEGMTDAGVQDKGLFSIILSRRTGPLDTVVNTAPRTQAVHMISLEGVGSMTSPASIGDTDFVAFVSLYSWTYLCQPPLSVNFVDSMRAIGKQMKQPTTHDNSIPEITCMLRCPYSLIDKVKKEVIALNAELLRQSQPPDPTQPFVKQDPMIAKLFAVKSSMVERLKNGYSLVRHRTTLGEETVALTRGPLIPITTQAPISTWPFSSNNGQDYQILDQTLGLMDISYSAAWQLGKTLAISDLGFVGALLRVRNQAHAKGMAASRVVRSAINGNFRATARVFGNLHDSVATIKNLCTSDVTQAPRPPNLQQRWARAAPLSKYAVEATQSNARHPEVKSAFKAGVNIHTRVMASTAGSDATDIYNELGPPQNSDWGIVLSWVLDHLYLHAIPGQYLVTDASYLPAESIRFFHIDLNWMEAFVDGALSVANHLGADDDSIRDSLKERLNDYFGSTLGAAPNSHNPQIPVYGFLLHSAVVTVFPDLHVDAPFPPGSSQNGRSPILVQKRMGKDILMCLFDRLPDAGELGWIKLSQPAHQQRFSVGDFLDASSVEFLFRDLFPPNSKGSNLHETDDGFLHEIGDPQTVHKADKDPNPKVYDWNSRCLNLNRFQDMLFGTKGVMPGKATKMTSAMVGLELNDTIKYLQLMPPVTNPNLPVGKPYHFRVRSDPPEVAQAAHTLLTLTSPKANSRRVVEAPNHPPLPSVSVRIRTKLPSSSVPGQLRSAINLPPDLTGAPPPSATKTNNVTDAARKVGDTGMIDQQYTCSIFPSTSTYDKANINKGYVYVNTPYSPDLIFSVNRRGRGVLKAGLLLQYVQFTIPTGDPTKRGKPPTGKDIITGPGLVPEDSFCGVRARMLNNQRWVVHSDATNTGYQVWRIVPRSTLRESDIFLNANLSFKLDEVDIAGGDGLSQVLGIVTVRVREVYGYWEKDGTHHDQGYAEYDVPVRRMNGWQDSMDQHVS